MHDSVPVWLVSRSKWEGGKKKKKDIEKFCCSFVCDADILQRSDSRS